MENMANKTNLQEYLEFAGILTCNDNPYLPSLSDIGCEWPDVTALIDSHGLFYCKAYRNRTTYLSNQAYFLLKQCRSPKPMDVDASKIYELLKNAEALDSETLKPLSCLDPKKFTKAFNFLLENLYITAYKNGKVLNPNWSTFYYSTAETWEQSVKKPCAEPDPRITLKAILLRTMPEREFDKFLR